MDFFNSRSPAPAATRASQRGVFDFGVRRPARGEISLGFHESSFDLKQGCEVYETPVALMPDELMREFRRQLTA